MSDSSPSKRPKQPFRFQQFSVSDERASMKVGTDGVLLGAWAPIRDARLILDVGTGCGLIALMLAQRTAGSDCRIEAIDIDRNAAEQACENFKASPWPDRLPQSPREVHCSLEEFSQDESHSGAFDLIVCNPPFFANAYPSPIAGRRIARQAEKLSILELLRSAFDVLDRNGRLCLVMPYENIRTTMEYSEDLGFYVWMKQNIIPKPGVAPKRVLVELGRSEAATHMQVRELVLESARHQHTVEHAELVKDFYLRYTKNPKTHEVLAEQKTKSWGNA